jgi:hypothetical protein
VLDSTPDAADRELRAWAASGAMALTGSRHGPPIASPGRPATRAKEALAELDLYLPGVLGERAAFAGLRRNAPSSCGGAYRTIRAADGHLALSLARQSDIDLVPALVEANPHGPPNPWALVEAWAARVPAREAAERFELLGLPGGLLTDPPDDRPGVMAEVHGSRTVRQRSLVVDLTSLWAGPLCAHILGLAGHDVVKVESRTRPDGARKGPRAFFALLHDGHRQVTIDFDNEIEQLAELIHNADLVLESSRPRAMEQLGIDAKEVVESGTSWLSITAAGRTSNAVGFGDDVAVRAGLRVTVDGRISPVGDAIADPLAGIAAALAATRALQSEAASLIDVSMLHVAAGAARGTIAEHVVVQDGDGWWIETGSGRWPVREPHRRRGTR